jgi:hypothetical protein
MIYLFWVKAGFYDDAISDSEKRNEQDNQSMKKEEKLNVIFKCNWCLIKHLEQEFDE